MSAPKKTPVLTTNAPKPLPGIYSQAIKAGGFVFVSGAVPMDAETGKLIDGDIQAHTVSILSLFLIERDRHKEEGPGGGRQLPNPL